MTSVGDIIQLNARYTLADGQIAENVFHLEVLVSGTEAEVRSAAVEYLEDMFTVLAGYQNAGVTALDVLFRNITAGTPTETLSWDDYAGGTSISAVMMPPGVAALVSAGTTIAKAVGRKYFAGLVADAWNGSGWIALVMTALASIGLDWIEDYADVLTGVEFRPVLQRAGTPAYVPFTDVIARSEAAYQRRRREGVGY